jgi:hypothetical protein
LERAVCCAVFRLALERSRGSRTYNGRARKPIEALEAAGLVSVDWDMDLVTKGTGTQGL